MFGWVIENNLFMLWVGERIFDFVVSRNKKKHSWIAYQELELCFIILKKDVNGNLILEVHFETFEPMAVD